MFKLINNKLLIAILAALTALGTFFYHEHEVNVRAAEAAERAAALLQKQRDDAEAAKKADAETWRKVQENRKKHDSTIGNGSKTWKTYIP